MGKYEWDENDEFEAWAKTLEENSPYKRIPMKSRKWMSAREMGILLGLKKTERYWLIRKNYFKTEEILGKIRIDIESFEKWYANQARYHKVTGEEPGLELKKSSYSPQDIAEMLGLSSNYIYELILRDNIETVIVDGLKRVPNEVFWKWYKGQKRFRTKEDRARDAELEEITITIPEMARAMGIARNTVRSLVNGKHWGRYFTDPIIIGERKRYFKKDFEEFLEAQDLYRLEPKKKLRTLDDEDDFEIIEREKEQEADTRNYYTMEEAAVRAEVSRSAVNKWCIKGMIQHYRYGRSIRIPKKEFDEWLKTQKIRKRKK